MRGIAIAFANKIDIYTIALFANKIATCMSDHSLILPNPRPHVYIYIFELITYLTYQFILPGDDWLPVDASEKDVANRSNKITK